MMLQGLKKSRVLLCRLLEAALILAVLVLVLVVTWGVLTRGCGSLVAWLEARGHDVWDFLPRGQNKYSEEFARFLMVWVALLGGAVAFGEKAHLGVDYFVGKLAPEARKLVAVFGAAVVLFFAVSIFILGGTDLALSNMQQMAPALGPPTGLKMGHVYLALPIAGVFIILFTVEQLLETLIKPASQDEEEDR